MNILVDLSEFNNITKKDLEGWKIKNAGLAGCFSEEENEELIISRENQVYSEVSAGGKNMLGAKIVIRAIGEIVEPPLKGDLDGNGCLDKVDLDIILAAIRGPEPRDAALDLNGDGVVNIADSRYLVMHFTNLGGTPCFWA
jgi:hypothetical protein